MTAEELWKKSGLQGEYERTLTSSSEVAQSRDGVSRSEIGGRYEAWQFGEAPDKLADLVKKGIKTATCSAYELYEAEHEPVPKAGDYSIILDSKDNAVCVIRTTRAYVTPFDLVTEEHAFKEGEGDRSLAYWREVHESFLKRELALINRSFDGHTKVLCEEFEVVYD